MHQGDGLAKIVAFANQKGGVAKTTTTLNLGVAVQELGRRVLLVDLDPQGNLTMSLGLDPDAVRPNMYDVLTGGAGLEETIAKTEIDVAVASIDLAAVEIALSSLIGRERALSKAFFQVVDAYDYIFIDTPPSLGLLTVNAFTAANAVIVPVQCEYLSLRGLEQLTRTLDLVRENLNPAVRIAGIVPTMYDSRLGHDREAVEVLRKSFGDLVCDTAIPKTVKFAEAPVKGESVLKYAPIVKLPKHIASLRERCSMEKRSSIRDSALRNLFSVTEPKAEGGLTDQGDQDFLGQEALQRARAETLEAGSSRPRVDEARRSLIQPSRSPFAVIRVVGVGGAGTNAINRMIETGVQGVEFIAINTDTQALAMCEAEHKLHIGAELTKGLGGGSDPKVGRDSAMGAYDEIKIGAQGQRHGLCHRR